MKNLKYLITIFAITIFLVSIVSASFLIPANDNAKENARAPEKSPVIDNNWNLERVDFIHYARPTLAGKGKTDNCYKLMGLKWTILPVNYVINPNNSQGLSVGFITSAISTSAETWDSATSGELFNNVYGVDYTARYGVQNFVNAIAFGDYPDNNVIAITSVWYTRVGKRIVEFDQLYNTRYSWGNADTNSSIMDLQNIAVHELGHGVGLGDIYSVSCSAVTMYGYSDFGETQKRTLESADITGLQKMYGV